MRQETEELALSELGRYPGAQPPGRLGEDPAVRWSKRTAPDYYGQSVKTRDVAGFLQGNEGA